MEWTRGAQGFWCGDERRCRRQDLSRWLSSGCTRDWAVPVYKRRCRRQCRCRNPLCRLPVEQRSFLHCTTRSPGQPEHKICGLGSRRCRMRLLPRCLQDLTLRRWLLPMLPRLFVDPRPAMLWYPAMLTKVACLRLLCAGPSVPNLTQLQRSCSVAGNGFVVGHIVRMQVLVPTRNIVCGLASIQLRLARLPSSKRLGCGMTA